MNPHHHRTSLGGEVPLPTFLVRRYILSLTSEPSKISRIVSEASTSQTHTNDDSAALSALEISGPINAFIEWYKQSRSPSPLQSLTLWRIRRDDLPGVGHFLRALGPSLQFLRLHVACPRNWENHWPADTIPSTIDHSIPHRTREFPRISSSSYNAPISHLLITHPIPYVNTF